MNRNFIIASLMVALPFAAKAEEKTVSDTLTNNTVDTEHVVRIADIEVYPEYLDDFLKAAKEIAATSIREEAGVVCLFPCQLKEDSTRFRIVEIYASQAAYQHHIQTAHFLHYKQKTLKMVKALKQNDVTPLNVGDMSMLFKKIQNKG